jgi:hypothetical protein
MSSLFTWLIICLFHLVFSAGTVFFSHNKSANSVFQPAYQPSFMTINSERQFMKNDLSRPSRKQATMQRCTQCILAVAHLSCHRPRDFTWQIYWGHVRSCVAVGSLHNSSGTLQIFAPGHCNDLVAGTSLQLVTLERQIDAGYSTTIRNTVVFWRNHPCVACRALLLGELEHAARERNAMG